jgi:ATP adenylyltransferase
MDQLWAPWRMAYVTKEPQSFSHDECFFCKGLSEKDDRKNQIVVRKSNSVVYLNRFPYNNGHLLVAPLSHKARLDELNEEEVLEIHQTVQQMTQLIEKLMNAEGFNIGLNLGKVAGAGVPGHLHWHIVPRWFGDTNFMPVVFDTKVIVQSLDSLYDLLTSHLLV